ncbi:MAG: hypothetical protein U0905_21270 [Pirellulales bacterium]
MDATFALGGNATLWRSYSDEDPQRMVRGVLIEMAPGLETLSVLLSPEGTLVPLDRIEDAELGKLDQAEYCRIATQTAGPMGHVAVLSLLDSLQKHFMSNLEVHDSTGFYATRDWSVLLPSAASDSKSLPILTAVSGLSSEAIEDPEIVIARLHRVQQLVHHHIAQRGDTEIRPAASPTLGIDEEKSLEEEVAVATQDHQDRQRKMDRILRYIEEQMATGSDFKEAMAEAFKQHGVLREEAEGSIEEESNDLEWEAEDWEEEDEDDDMDWEEESMAPEIRHPILSRAESVLVELYAMQGKDAELNNHLQIASRGLGDVVGGIVQASVRVDGSRMDRAYSIVQLRRALRGLAFFRGALFAMRSNGTLDEERFQEYQGEFFLLLEAIHQMLDDAWDEDQLYE